MSGALFLKSNMTLRINGTLKGTTSTSDYPIVPSRFEGFELNCYASLVTLGTRSRTTYTIHDVVIDGTGVIDGNGAALGSAEKSASGNRSRGRAIVFHSADRVWVNGITASYGPAWTVHAIYSRNLSFSNMRLISKNSSGRIANGDGIDPDSSTFINIFNNYFHTGDDSVAIKSGKNNEGYTIGKPTEDVRVTDNTIDGSNGGIVIGSEMSGSVRRVLIQNNTLGGLSWEALDIKSNVVRGGTVEQIDYRDNVINSTRLAIRVTTNYSVNNDGTPAPVPPTIRDFKFRNIVTHNTSGRAVSIVGLSNSKVRNGLFRDCVFNSSTGVIVDWADSITFQNVQLNISSGSQYTITNSTNIVH
jgi:exo-poly-alpha-galacturonosidase